MGLRFSKKGIERVILKSVLNRPYTMFLDSKIYYTPSKIEEVILSQLQNGTSAKTLAEFEAAVQNPEIESIYIGKYAAITSAALKNILERNGLSKTIYCAFNLLP